MIEIHEADCLVYMRDIASASIDMILTDLPYGTTYAPWDLVIPLKELWSAWLRIVKPKGAIVLTASQPFTSQLVMSRPDLFRCEWIWNKINAANFANANKQPLKVHESVCVFATGQTTYNPQKTQGTPNHSQGRNARARSCETQKISERSSDNLDGAKFPISIQTFPKHSSQSKLHSTQKPVDLFRYLIETYSNPGEIVLDCCAGSGTTGEAAALAGRRAILIENDSRHIETIRRRPTRPPSDEEGPCS